MLNQNDSKEILTEEHSQCHFCSKSGEVIYEELSDRLFGTEGTWRLVRCPDLECGLVWLNPRPQESNIMKAYATYLTHGEDENIYSKKGKNKAKTLFLTFLQKSMRRSRLNIWLKYIGKKPNGTGRLLEVGCGDGRKLVLMKEHGWKVEGQEIDAKAAEVARTAAQCEVHVGALDALSFPENTFDAIIMSHVIEHVFDPTALLKECLRILKPQGRLICVTPNTQSLGHKYFKTHWIGLDPPRHIHIFNSDNLKCLSQNAGFKEIDVSTTSINAALLNLTSFDFKMHNAPIRNVSLINGMKAFGFSFIETLGLLFNRNLGEECLLICKKKT